MDKRTDRTFMRSISARTTTHHTSSTPSRSIGWEPLAFIGLLVFSLACCAFKAMPAPVSAEQIPVVSSTLQLVQEATK